MGEIIKTLEVLVVLEVAEEVLMLMEGQVISHQLILPKGILAATGVPATTLVEAVEVPVAQEAMGSLPEVEVAAELEQILPLLDLL